MSMASKHRFVNLELDDQPLGDCPRLAVLASPGNRTLSVPADEQNTGNPATTVSLTALSLTAALPAAASLAQSAVEAGGQLGSGFLDVLSGLTDGKNKNEEPAPTTKVDETHGSSKLGLLSRAQSWSEKLMNWLSQHPSTQDAAAGDLELELSLDSLDQPHVAVQGENAEAIEAALVADPTCLQEFRELALDRSAELGGPAGGSASAPPLRLKITRRDGETQAAWQ